MKIRTSALAVSAALFLPLVAFAQTQKSTIAGVEGPVLAIKADKASYVSFDCNDSRRYSISITDQNLSLVSAGKSERCNPNSISLVGELKQNGKAYLLRGQLFGRATAGNLTVSSWSGALVTLPTDPVFASVVIDRLEIPVKNTIEFVTEKPSNLSPSESISVGAVETAGPADGGSGSALRCEASKCVSGGSGPYCEYDLDCRVDSKYCRADGKCVLASAGGDGRHCFKDSHCDWIKTCLNGVCRLGGNGVNCVGDADCQRKRCNLSGACMLGGEGIDCEDDGECSKTYCVTRGCYMADVGGGACTADGDCAVEKRCNAQAQCVPKKFPQLQHRCGSNADCLTRSCFNGKCIPGSTGGILCSSDAVCASTKTCFNGVCKAGNLGGTARCESAAQCSHLYCEDGKCVKKDWPGVSNCPKEGAPCPKATAEVEETAAPDTMGRLSDSALKPKAPLEPSEVVRKISVARPSFSIGSEKALITMAVFQDYDCGQCKRFMKDNWEYLKKDFVDKGTLKVEFFEFPLIRNREVARHYGAVCAADQHLYQEYMLQLYSGEKFKVEELETRVSKIPGLALRDWKKCMSNESALEAYIDEHRTLGGELGVEGTPTIFVNGISVPNFKDEVRKNVSEQVKTAALAKK